MVANALDAQDQDSTSELGTTVNNPGKQGSVTFMAAEAMAVEQFGERSADAISKVLTASGLALR